MTSLPHQTPGWKPGPAVREQPGMAAATIKKSPARFVRAFRFFQIKLVEEPVEGRRNNDAKTREERQAAKQCVTAGKNLAPVSL